MKKFLLLGLALLFLGSALFADDAKVMPMMVGRVYVAPTFSFAPGVFDTDGKYQKFDNGSVRLFNLGFAVEYGVINWITAAVQWVPGWTPWSDLEGPTGSDKTNVNGVADLFAGAKIQIVGEKAPVATNRVRFSVAPGVIIPMPGPDFEEQVKKMSNGEDATISSMDNHVFGAGARFYFDYVINEHFFINLYNETIFYPVKQDLNKYDPTTAVIKGGMLATYGAMMPPAAIAALNDVGGDVKYNYRLTFEIEPQFSTNIAKGLSFSAGLPINYRYTPAYDYSFKGLAALSLQTGGMFTEQALKDQFLGYLDTDPHHSLSVNPNVSLFLTSTPLPLEFKFQYGIPVYGQNTMARHNFTLQVKVYFALPGRPQ